MENKINNCAPSNREGKDWELHELATASKLPVEFSRRPFTYEPINQGIVGSCVGQTLRVVFGDTVQCADVDLSAMWIYKRAKEYDYWAGEDYSGTSVSGACEALRRVGACTETLFPYNSKTENVEPLDGAAEDASGRKIKAYFQLPITNVEEVKNLLLKESLAMSVNIHERFYDAKYDGVVPSEGYGDSKAVGGHAMTLTGWKEIDGELHWEFQNSWGIRWGDKGFAYIPHEVCKQFATSGCYYLVEHEEIDKGMIYGKKRKRKSNVLIQLIHGIFNFVLRIFGKEEKFK